MNTSPAQAQTPEGFREALKEKRLLLEISAHVHAYAEEITGHGSWTWDPETDKTVYSDNMFRLLGMEPGEMEPLFDTVASYAHPDERHRFLDRAHAVRSHKEHRSEYRVLLKDGSERLFSERSRMIRRDGDARTLIGIAEDVTDRRRSDEEKRHMLKERQDLEERQRTDLLKATLNAQETEQRRIAESLHNGMGQMLYGIQLNLGQLDLEPGTTWEERHAAQRNATQRLLSEAIVETRRISHELMPSVLEDFGIKAALEEICHQLSKTLEFHCETHDLPERIEQYLEIAIFRSMQELITNSLRHGQATRISVALRRIEGAYHFEVCDNGCGCEPGAKNDGIGLRTIRNKVALLKGDFVMESNGDGTIVRIRLPDGTARA